MLEGILCDVDGVIVDSEPMFYKVVHLTFLKFGVDLSVDEYVKYWMIDQTKSDGVIRDKGLDCSLDELRKVKQELIDMLIKDELELMPYGKELVEYLGERYPIAAVTSDSRRNCVNKLGKFGLVQNFDTIITGNDVSHFKPHPEPYQKGAEALDIIPANCVVIEDNPSGAISGLEAGCKVVVFPNGYTANKEFPGGVVRVGSLREIDQKLLEGLYR